MRWAGLALGLALLATMPGAARAQSSGVLGSPPTYASRQPGTLREASVPNAEAITARIWAPGLDEGFVPQGLAAAGRSIYVGAYRSVDKRRDRGPCRLFRIDAVTGDVTGRLDLPPSCGHAGGLAMAGPRRLWVVDTHVMHEVALADEAHPRLGRVLREVKLLPPLKGSLATSHDGGLWIGSYETDRPGRLWRFARASIGTSVAERDAGGSVALPTRAQGAAFDGKGRLWITRSGSNLGELVRVDRATGTIAERYRMPDGVEGIAFDTVGQIWTVSEAGSRRWLSWVTFFPVVFRVAPERLR